MALYFREWRLHAGFTQDALAKKMRVTKPTVSRIERGKRDFTGRYLLRFAVVCGCDYLGDPVSRPPWLELRVSGDAFSRKAIKERIEELTALEEKIRKTRSSH